MLRLPEQIQPPIAPNLATGPSFVENGPEPGAKDNPLVRIPLGEVARLHLARILEQTQGLVLMALIEQAGGDPRAPWALRLDAVTLVREERPTAPAPAP